MVPIPNTYGTNKSTKRQNLYLNVKFKICKSDNSLMQI